METGTFVDAPIRKNAGFRAGFHCFRTLLGNFTGVTTNGTTQTRTANQQNEYTSISGQGTISYDADGNITADGSGNTYVYDAWNRLVAVKNGSTTLASYCYYGLNRRITETHGTTTTDLYYSTNWQVLEEYNNGQLQARYVWSPTGTDTLVLRDDSSQHNGVLDRRLYVQQDANGNVTALIDTNGNVVERYAYDPFGAVTVLNPDFSVRGTSSYIWHYFFQGKRYDVSVGLYDSRERAYSPTLMRPLQADPLGQLPDYNPYRYEGNEPTDNTDPLGLWTLRWKRGIAGGLAGANAGGWSGLSLGSLGGLPGAVAGGTAGMIVGGVVGFITGVIDSTDYEGVDRFPMSGNDFYEGYIKPTYGDCWDLYKLGCIGLARIRLGIMENSPHPTMPGGQYLNLFKPDIIKKYKVKCFNNYQAAADYCNSHKEENTVILAAQFNQFKHVKPNPTLGKDEIDPNTVPTTGNGDYATLQYNPGCNQWYWEWMGTGAAGDDFNVKHRPFDPNKNHKGLPSSYNHTAYCVYTIPPK